ncbi:DNA sulfur modification protein DndD [Peribacillus deserti]|uniref:Nuclease SbcCD subunit C n=1 Tax=Peribacillus deserti TaxID=673318 RepID=A0ABS2QEP6_9BACI|nr:DNA sulfur modification protein DndD [Peribacillus deserti]MBM7691625.1 DNA sulfur modification protein DndD [Peribacillus deserti]
MIINEIQLTNIGAYRGINSFDFRPGNDQNVILIGGENGAGKTTLLNAIKLGLFGSYGYGFKTDNSEYFKRVITILNHDAKKINENNFRIKLEFSLIDDFERTNYVLFRSWRFSGQQIKESIDLVANGKHLSEYEKEIFQSKLREVMPPQLLDLCLFDGEEIARIISEDKLSEYLKNLSRVVFNLDLFETLEVDLENFSSQTLDPEKMESAEKELYSLNLREKEQREKIKELINQVASIKERKSLLQDEYHQLKNDFEVNGGLVKAERDEILRQMSAIEATRKQNLEKIREFVSTLLPFYLSKDLLTQTIKQIENEESLQLYKQLNSKLTDEKISSILHSISSSISHSSSTELRNQVLNLVKPEKEITQIHGASFSESSLVENIHQQVIGDKDSSALNIIEENRTKLSELQELRSKLRDNDNANELSDMFEKMELIQQTVLKLEDELVKTESELEENKKALSITLSSIEKIQASLRDSDKTKSSFLESQKIIALSRRFREIQLKKKLQQVQIEASTMLKKIFRKHNYISAIIIEPETYNVVLLDSHKDHIEKSTLSAGEKEILLISIIWAIFKCSGRKVPFIFDTLLGRLDKTHKTAVLKEFIPNCGKQAIILSTDTEIDEIHYTALKPHIANEYMLDFNVERKQTQILNRYFPFRKMEMNV